MIKRSNQVWEIGCSVKVSFLTLTILGKIPTPGDGMPDQYRLANAKGKEYIFTPHYGLEAL